MARISLPQALAWIIWRDEARVSRLDEVRLSVMEVINAAVLEANGNEAKTKVAFAGREDLFGKLRSGRLIAFGIKPGENLHEIIPSIDWEVVDSLHCFDDVGWDDVGRGGVTLYKNVLVEKADVLQFWPEGAPDLLEACRKALQQGHSTQADAFKVIREAGVNCTREEFLAVWRTIAGPQKQGPKGPRTKTPK